MTAYWNENLVALRKRKNWSQKELADASGITQGQISNLEKGKRGFKQATLEPIMEALGCTLADVFVENVPSGLSVAGTFEQEFDIIPKYKARLSGGHGSLLTSDQIEANLAFRKEFISRKGNGNNMILFEVTGDSMEPFIHEGDVIMVDRSCDNPKEIVDGKAYAFREEDTVKVKRLSRQGGKLLATSENFHKYPPYEIDTGNFTLFGKVVWVGHEVR